jgi:acetyl/propionyl-CoA carboxylase alpha subunit
MGAGGIEEAEVSGNLNRLLVANRGEIAIRVMRAAAELGIPTLAVYPEDDADSLHTKKADEAVRLPGQGARAYLDTEAILELAREQGCDALHPGYGFLSENAGLARRCGEAGIVFVGPCADTLELFGDKVRARSVAAEHGVPVLAGTSEAASLAEAHAFLASLAEGEAMIIKAVSGGGGRGVRVVRSADELGEAYERASSEARSAFGNPEVYLERFLPQARHIEVQIAGDASGEVSHFWERDCSLQRRHQKIVEFAPSPALPPETRARILEAAVRLGRESGYTNLGTFEFLVDAASGDDTSFAFLEANARLQVEHTVTEEVTGVDLVQLQLQLASGHTLSDLGLMQEQVPAPRGFAVEARVNMETMRPDGMATPAGGTLTAFEPPSGHGVRTDSFGYAGYPTSPRYDSLLAKLIAHSQSSSFLDAVTRADRALAEFRVEGVSTNIPFLRALLEHPAVRAGRVSTRFIDEHIAELVAASRAERRTLHVGSASVGTRGEALERSLAGVRVDRDDPLAVLAYGQEEAAARRAAVQGTDVAAPPGTVPVDAPLQGTIVSIEVAEGDAVLADQLLLVMESMKMEHEVRAPAAGTLYRVEVEVGDTIYEGHTLFLIEEGEVEGVAAATEGEIGLDHVRADLRQVLDRRAATRDERRPAAVERRHSRGQRTVQENAEDLFDPGTIIEYGALVLAAQRARRSIPELIEKSPRDGMITAVGSVNGHLFPDPVNRVAIIAYDYTVFAGTQGGQNHRKTDRMIKVAREARLPLVLFARALRGGGRRKTRRHGRTRWWARRHAQLLSVRHPERARADGRHHLRTLLRRQRLAARVLRRDHRDRELEHRHGRPGDGRGRRARRLRAGGHRRHGRAGTERRGGHRRGGRG